MKTNNHLEAGSSLLNEGRPTEAIAELRKAVELLPNEGHAYHVLAFALSITGHAKEAEPYFEIALVLNPKDERAWFNLGNLQRERLGSNSRAEASYLKAIALKPTWADAYVNLGVSRRFDMAGALSAYGAALTLKPEHPHALCNTMHAATWLAHWKGRDALLMRLRTELAAAAEPGAAGKEEPDEILKHAQPWQMLAYPFAEELAQRVASAHAFMSSRRVTDAAMLETAPRWWKQQQQERRGRHGSQPLQQRKTRLVLGYLASDLRASHPVGQLMSHVFGLHKRGQHRVVCLDSNGGRREISRAIKRGCDQLISIPLHSISSEQGGGIPKEVDVLIDLNGHTEGSRTDLLSSSNAKVRCLAVAYPASLGGHSLVHYLLADAPSVWPVGKQLPSTLYPERLALMPRFFLASDHLASFGPPSPLATTSSLPPSYCSMSTFAQMYKLQPSTFTTWMNTLRRLHPQCSLLLLTFQPDSIHKLNGETAALGLYSKQRLQWLPMLKRSGHLERARTSAYLSLDTPGYNQGTSGLDALWAGLPLLTLPARRWCGRMGAGLLASAGMLDTGVASLRGMEDVSVALFRARAGGRGGARLPRRRPSSIEVSS